MTYTLAALLGVAGALLVDLVVLRTRLVRRPLFWVTYPVVLGGQLLSNGVLTSREIVRYDPAAIVGPRLVYAPVEDLFFGFALVLLTLSLWVWLGRIGVQRTPSAGVGSVLLRRRRTFSPYGGSPRPPTQPGPGEPRPPDPPRPARPTPSR